MHDRANHFGAEAYGKSSSVESSAGRIFCTLLQHLAPNMGHNEILDRLRHPFQSTIKTNKALWYLINLNSSIEGVAARTVQGLTFTEGKYDSAVVLLKECFGKS